MNIYDIAQKAGVSPSTVSRVINDSAGVSEKKRNQVLKVLNETNYVRSSIARSLTIKSTQTIGILTVDIRQPFEAIVSFNIENVLSKAGYNVILCNTNYYVNDQVQYLKMLAEKQVDGIIMVGSIYISSIIEENINKFLPKTPIVMHNGNFSSPMICNVNSNGLQGIELGIRYLLNKHREKIVYIQDKKTLMGEAKKNVFIKIMRENKIELHENSIMLTDVGIESGKDVVNRLLNLNVDYNAFIGCEDITAIGIMKQLKHIGKRIPQDVAVIGFNNTRESYMCDPELTSIDTKPDQIGINLGNSLIKLIQGQHVSNQVGINPELVLKKST